MKTQVELGSELFESLLTYEDAFSVLDGKVRSIFRQQSNEITKLQIKVEQ